MPAYNRDAATRATWTSDGLRGCADRNMLEHGHDGSNRALSVWRGVLSHHGRALVHADCWLPGDLSSVQRCEAFEVMLICAQNVQNYAQNGQIHSHPSQGGTPHVCTCL